MCCGQGAFLEIRQPKQVLVIPQSAASVTPVRPAVHIPPIERLRRPRSSDDPRAAAAASGWGDLTALAVALGLPAGGPLRMPSIRLT